jgi:hypothetical protein
VESPPNRGPVAAVLGHGERSFRRLRSLPVAVGDVRAAYEQLAGVAVDVPPVHDADGLVEFRLHVDDRRADGPRLRRVVGVDAEHRRGLGEPVALQDRDAHPVVEPAEPLGEAPAAGDEEVDVTAERLADSLEHQLVGDPVFRREQRTRVVGALVGTAHARRPLEDALLDR